MIIAYHSNIHLVEQSNILHEEATCSLPTSIISPLVATEADVVHYSLGHASA